jgi:hypothetical protein
MTRSRTRIQKQRRLNRSSEGGGARFDPREGVRLDPNSDARRRSGKKRWCPVDGLDSGSPIEGLNGDNDSFGQKQTRQINRSPAASNGDKLHDEEANLGQTW